MLNCIAVVYYCLVLPLFSLPSPAFLDSRCVNSVEFDTGDDYETAGAQIISDDFSGVEEKHSKSDGG